MSFPLLSSHRVVDMHKVPANALDPPNKDQVPLDVKVRMIRIDSKDTPSKEKPLNEASKEKALNEAPSKEMSSKGKVMNEAPPKENASKEKASKEPASRETSDVKAVVTSKEILVVPKSKETAGDASKECSLPPRDLPLTPSKEHLMHAVNTGSYLEQSTTQPGGARNMLGVTSIAALIMARSLDSETPPYDPSTETRSWERNHVTSSVHHEQVKPTLRYKAEIGKTVVVGLAFLTAVMCNQLALAVASDIISRHPLPDLLHALVEEDKLFLHILDWAVMIGSGFSLVFLVVLHKHRFIVVRRMFAIGTVVFIMRALSIAVTHLPPGYKDNEELCYPPEQSTNYPLELYLKKALIIFTNLGLQMEDSAGKLYCGDMLFSGHTTIISLACFFMNTYTSNALWPIRVVMVATCMTGALCAILSRAHYSVDVIMGYWISSLIFSLYHAFCAVPHEQRTKARAFRRLLIFWTLFECEKNVPAGKIPNLLSWPFAYPECFVRFFDNFSYMRSDTKAGRLAIFFTNHRIKTHM